MCSQTQVVALDALGECFANDLLVVRNQALITGPIIGANGSKADDL